MWGSLSSAHQIMVLLSLRGTAEYDAKMAAASAETNAFARSLLRTGKAMTVATERTWMQNQALFTARRYLFYATLAVTGLVFAVAKLGFQYDSTVQSARVALKTILPQRQLDDVINRLYKISTLSPFLFQDTLGAFRMLYPAFHAAGISAKDAMDTIQASANALSVQGKLSAGQLTRVAVQMQHLANIGRPTGQILTALARDGLPVYSALRKELHLTGTSLTDLASSGYSAKQIIEALNKYMLTTAPYKGAAERISLQTLQGNWQMFKDILAQAAGRAEGGLFSGLTARIKKVNQALIPAFAANKPIGIYMIADAIDRALTPRTHIIINLFVLFASTLKMVLFLFGLFFGILQLVLFPLDYFASLLGQNWVAMKILGAALGVLLFLWGLAKIRLMALAAQEEIQIFLVWASGASVKALAFATWLWNAAMDAANIALIWLNTLLTWENVRIWAATAAVIAMMAATWLWNAATDAMTGAMIALDAAMWANPIGLIILAVLALTAGLVVLYFKWKAFHDLVNKTFGFLWSHPWAATLIPIVGQLILMARVLLAIYNNAARIADLASHPLRHIENAVHGRSALGTASSVAGWITNPFGSLAGVLGFQHGGFIGRGGLALVGERGPELVHLPAASVVQPFSRNMMGSGVLAIHVYPQDIYLDSKKIGSVLATAITDKEARR